eukprot:Filipodium_phascolosomae@DN2916_c0_g1_i1.p1
MIQEETQSHNSDTVEIDETKRLVVGGTFENVQTSSQAPTPIITTDIISPEIVAAADAAAAAAEAAMLNMSGTPTPSMPERGGGMDAKRRCIDDFSAAKEAADSAAAAINALLLPGTHPIIPFQHPSPTFNFSSPSSVDGIANNMLMNPSSTATLPFSPNSNDMTAAPQSAYNQYPADWANPFATPRNFSPEDINLMTQSCELPAVGQHAQGSSAAAAAMAAWNRVFQLPPVNFPFDTNSQSITASSHPTASAAGFPDISAAAAAAAGFPSPQLMQLHSQAMLNVQSMGALAVPPDMSGVVGIPDGSTSNPVIGDDLGVRMEDPAVLTAQARHQVRVAGLSDEQLANVYSPHKLTRLEDYNSTEGIEQSLEVMQWHPGISFSLGEAGREVLRAYVRQKAGLRGQKMQNISIPKLLEMAHENGLWPSAVRTHLEHCGRLPMSTCHQVMKTYKESLNTVRRRNRKAFMRSSLTAAAYHCCHDSIPYQEGLALRLGSEGRKQLLDIMREKHVREREQVDRLLAAEGLCYSDMRNASLPVLFKMAHTMGLWSQAVRLHLEYSTKGGGQVGAVSYRIQRRHEWRTRNVDDAMIEDIGLLRHSTSRLVHHLQPNPADPAMLTGATQEMARSMGKQALLDDGQSSTANAVAQLPPTSESAMANSMPNGLPDISVGEVNMSQLALPAVPMPRLNINHDNTIVGASPSLPTCEDVTASCPALGTS